MEALTGLLLSRNARVALEASKLLAASKPTGGAPKLLRRVRRLRQDLATWSEDAEDEAEDDRPRPRPHFISCGCRGTCLEVLEPVGVHKQCPDVLELLKILDQLAKSATE